MKRNTKNTYEIGRKIVDILAINVDSTSKERVLAGVKEMMAYNSKFYIVTPNPELVLASTKNLLLKRALNHADFAIPDGIGLAQAAKFLSLQVPQSIFVRVVVTFFQGLAVGLATFFNRKWLTEYLNVIKGRELFLDIVGLAHKKGWRMFFLGGLGNEAEIAAKKLDAKYFRGPKMDSKVEPISKFDRKLQEDAIDKINKFTPNLLFVAFGNPKQEIWIYENLPKLSVGGAMAVGGAFRYVAGLSKLPPKWMERTGIEWLWRLLTEPFRLKRIWNAVVVFPWKVFLSKNGRENGY